MKKLKNRIYLSIHAGHNASASLMINGKIIFTACEERYRKIKNIMGYPKNAIEACFKFSGIKSEDIDKVAFTTINYDPIFIKSQYFNKLTVNEYWEYYLGGIYSKNPKKRYKYISWLYNNKRFYDKEDIVDYSFIKLNKNYFKNSRKIQEQYRETLKQTVKRHINIPIEKIYFLDHHTCHAYYAYFGSPFRDKNTNVITLDSWGDNRNLTVWKASKNKLKLISESSQNDIGRIYKFATLILGMRPAEHEFKVMGMAPYAKKKYLLEAYEPLKNLSCVKNLKILNKNRPKDLLSYLQTKWRGVRFDNISGAVQHYTEKIVMDLIMQIYKKNKISRFVLSGGIALNIKMNQQISKLDIVKDIFVCGSGGDESLSIGGNYYLNRNFVNEPLKNMYLGANINDEKKKINVIKNKSYKTSIVQNPSKIAKLLAKDEIVAAASGRSEFGVRALGNRSIFANPSNINNVLKINKAIKSRDFWMPFALSIINSEHKKYLINPKNILCPSMTITFDTQEKKRSEICCGIHPYDFTARPQFVSKKDNKYYYNLLKEFKKLTGIPALLNTSFNLHGEPIIETTDDAIRTFLKSDLDHLWLYNYYLLSKR